MAVPQTLETVFNRARNYLNDAAGQIWSDTALSVLAQDAYDWLFNEIAIHAEAPFEKIVADIPYTAANRVAPGQIDTINDLLPADMLFPLILEWRASGSFDYVRIDRVSVLPDGYANHPPIRMHVWEYSDRSIKVVAPQESGMLRLRYQALLPTISEGTDVILMNNAVGALSHYLASIAFSRRGQVQQAAIEMGKEQPPTGALGFAFQVTTLIVKNEQHVPRRMGQFAHGSEAEELTRYG